MYNNGGNALTVSGNRQSTVSIRFTKKEKRVLEKTARDLGFKSISSYLRHLHNDRIKEANAPVEYVPGENTIEIFHKTARGNVYCGGLENIY
jgi:hypothetical protein